MDATDREIGLKPAYEMLLTALCQAGLASAWGWSMSVADQVSARTAVVTWALAFGDPTIHCWTAMLRQYADDNLLKAPLTPLVCSDNQLSSVLHITASCHQLGQQLDGMDVLVWDAGKGLRMASLLPVGSPKGDIIVAKGHRLYHFAAGAARWITHVLREMNRDYVAFVAADQIVCLFDSDRQELRTLLDAVSSQDADMIFFDGPPALSLVRLRFLLDPAQPPRRDSLMALARDRLLLKEHGGAHAFQCVLLKRSLMPALVNALEAILEAARNGYDVDYGVNDVAILSKLIRPDWLRKERHPGAQRIYAALHRLRTQTRRLRSISLPLQVFNVNLPAILEHLKMRIGCDMPCGE